MSWLTEQRRFVSFLLAQGHPDAALYPLCHLWTEVTIARERVNAQMASEAALMYQIVQTVMGGQEQVSALTDTLKRLGNGG